MLPASISFQAGAFGPGMIHLVPRSLIICKWEGRWKIVRRADDGVAKEGGVFT